MTPLTDEQLNEIEKAARAAVAEREQALRDWPDEIDPEYMGGCWDVEREYPGTANPVTVLSLIAQARRNRRVEEAAIEHLAMLDDKYDPAPQWPEIMMSAERLRAALKETADAN